MSEIEIICVGVCERENEIERGRQTEKGKILYCTQDIKTMRHQCVFECVREAAKKFF